MKLIFFLIYFFLSVFYIPSCTKIGTVVEYQYECPTEMALVNNPNQKIIVCLDRYEFSWNGNNIKNSYPLGYLNYETCSQLCKSRDKRLPTGKEWSTACQGTKPEKCNIFRLNPIIARQKAPQSWVYRDQNCKTKRNSFSYTCMNDPSLNLVRPGLARNGDFSGCVSDYGVYHMVGNLGEWISEQFYRGNEMRGQFNGGLYPQPLSSCSYKTIAHGPRYRDYSIGCRCAKNPKVITIEKQTITP